MKKLIALTVIVIATALVATSCQKDNMWNVDQNVLDTFKSQFPNAKQVTWETKGIYYVADFKDNKVEKVAWYTRDAQWLMIEEDENFNALPQAVQDAFNSSAYAGWRIDDIDFIIRPNVETVYVIEVEQGTTEVELHYSANGQLLSEQTEIDDDDDDDDDYEPLGNWM